MIRVLRRSKLFLLLASMLFVMLACDKNDEEIPFVDFRDEMRQFVIDISEYARTYDGGFIVIPQNGQELITNNGEADGEIMNRYLDAIDGVGREDLFYGYHKDNRATPEDERTYMIAFCNLFAAKGKIVLVTDYCTTPSNVDDSYSSNNEHGFISFAASERDLNVIPNYPSSPFQQNANSIHSLSEAENFLYLINSEFYNDKSDFIKAIGKTNYDAIIIDLFHNELMFTANEIELLKLKDNGSKRLVICYMSIGEAEDYRFYWENDWEMQTPLWLDDENPSWEGNYKVTYWDINWQNIIYGSPNSYLDKIIVAGFDGVYLDIIDAFEYFE